jgi:hypothetical protein
MLFTALFALAATHDTARPMPKANLVGRWEEYGTCQGDYDVVFRASGIFDVSGAQGRWTLNGRMLTTQLTTVAGADGRWRPKKSEKQYKSMILSWSETRIVERTPDGIVHHWHRC